MKALIDTCSLLQMVRYYVPFDKSSVLSGFLQKKIQQQELIVIDAVHIEAQRISQSIIIETFPFLNDKRHVTNTANLVPINNRKFFNLLDNNFIRGALRRNLSDIEYETQKSSYLQSADCKLLIFCNNYLIEHSSNLFPDPIVIVTEESTVNNDNKLFHKIPEIGALLNIRTLTLTEYLQASGEVDILISNPQENT